MDKKLEARIARLERMINRKNENVLQLKEITLKDFLGDLYDDLMLLTNNDKQYILNILEHYADKTGFFERIIEHIEYLENEKSDRG